VVCRRAAAASNNARKSAHLDLSRGTGPGVPLSLRRAIMESNFDSVLDSASSVNPARLTIVFKVLLVPLDPMAGGSPPTSMHPGPAHLAANAASTRRGNVLDSNQTPVKCRSWTRSTWPTTRSVGGIASVALR